MVRRYIHLRHTLFVFVDNCFPGSYGQLCRASVMFLTPTGDENVRYLKKTSSSRNKEPWEGKIVKSMEKGLKLPEKD